MAIQEQVWVELAEVEVNDEYRIELTQLRKVMDYSPEQAEQLANELLQAAEQANRMLAEQLDAMHDRMIGSTPRTTTGEYVL